MPLEKTLVIVKPDGVQRRLVGQILGRFEAKGLRVAALKLTRISPELAARHYAVHREKPFYEKLVRFMTSAPVVVAVLEGISAVAVCRKLMGATFGSDAEAGTIRGDWGLSKGYNVVHGSDSLEAARREIELFFSPDEVLDYPMHDYRWVYDESEDLT